MITFLVLRPSGGKNLLLELQLKWAKSCILCNKPVDGKWVEMYHNGVVKWEWRNILWWLWWGNWVQDVKRSWYLWRAGEKWEALTKIHLTSCFKSRWIQERVWMEWRDGRHSPLLNIKMYGGSPDGKYYPATIKHS